MGQPTPIQAGLRGQYVHRVEPQHLINYMGAGVPGVFSSPWMLWCMEHAARNAVLLCMTEGEDTVGVGFDFRHLAPTPEGATVTATAEVVGVEGRFITFAIEARDEHDLIGQGTHVRAVVETSRFAKRIRRKLEERAS